VLTHVLAVPRWAATGLGTAAIAVQLAAAVRGWPGPADTLGSLALWGMRQEPVDLLALVVVGAAIIAALATAGRLVVEPLVRRGDLVSQLRFAVTVQDLRTVVLLRRQLRNEHPRDEPWLRRRPTSPTGPTGAVWRRGWRGLARYPLPRIVRMVLLAGVAAVGVVAAVRGTTPALVATGVALHLLGLDAVEPLSQEIDRPDHTDSLPRDRGWLLVRHLAAPAVALVPIALLGAGIVVAFEPDAAAAAVTLAAPVTWAAVCGSVVTVVRDAPDLVAVSPRSAAMPPEVAGFASTIRLLLPVVVSVLGTAPVLAMRELPTAGTVLRSIAGAALLIAATVLWVRRRDHWAARWRAFLEGAQRAKAAS
nr:hypothetical protein [Acidimicrobiia bacterium]